MIKIDNFSKIQFFKFAWHFQVKIQKKSNKSQKKISATARLAAAAHASHCENIIRSEKKVIRVKNSKT